jgi:hypothetical protein
MSYDLRLMFYDFFIRGIPALLRLKFTVILLLAIVVYCGCGESVCFSQAGGIRQKKTIVSGDISSFFCKVKYWDNDTWENKSGYKCASSLRLSFNLGHYYYLNTSFNYYYDKDLVHNMPWLPDYSIMFTRSKYAPNTFYWGYNNFDSNKYSNSLAKTLDWFSVGAIYYGYYMKLPPKIIRFIRIDSTSNLQPSVQLNYSFRYYNQSGNCKGGVFSGKPVMAFNIQYTIVYGLYVSLSFFYYPDPYMQLPWNSDYSYGFGLANWKPWKIKISYYNIYNNGFPWSNTNVKSGFWYGDFGISFNYTFDYYKK